MKKVLFYCILSVLSLAFAACSSDDNGDDGSDGGASSIAAFVGEWYDSAEGEYIVYKENGTYYHRICNVNMAYEEQGRWEYHPSSAQYTEYADYFGQTAVLDFKVKAITDKYFILTSSKVAENRYEKVVASYNLQLNETVTVSDAYRSYTPDGSTNSRIATIGGDGVISSHGEKGTAFIALLDPASQYKVWVKVTVGDDCLDIWYDYVSALGMDFTSVKKLLGDDPQAVSDNGLGLFYKMSVNAKQRIDNIGIYLNPQTKKAEQVELMFPKEINVISQVEVESYLKSRYFPCKILGDGYYTTSEKLSDSKAVVRYDKESREVFIEDAKLYALPDYTMYRGYTAEQLTTDFGDLYKDKPIFYLRSYNFDVVMFSLDDNSKVEGYVLGMNETTDKNTVKAMLDEKYTYWQEKDSRLYYIDAASAEDAKWFIIYYPANETVTFMYIAG